MNVLHHTILNLLQANLPGSASHKKMLPPGRVLKAAPSNKAPIKHSSVLLLLLQEENELKAYLIKRPSYMKHHAGQIALPGGRMEHGETAIETALRETFEEIGITAEKIQILGKLTNFYVEVSNFQVQPIVGWLEKEPTFKLCEQEVEKIICFPIQKLKPPYDEVELETLTGKLMVPCIKYEGEVIWGATAMILSEFYDIVQKILD